MKKKISLLLCLLTMILMFTGCSQKEEALEYDEASIEQMTEFLIGYCNNADDATIEQWNNYSEFEQELQLMQAGLKFTPESFQGAMDSWKAGVEECGAYVSHGDYTYEADADGLVVSVPAKFAERDAVVSFTFNEKLYLESMTVNAKFTIGEILEKAGLNTVLGMGTVFAVLLLISFIISLFKYISKFEQAKSKKETDKNAVSVEAASAKPAANETAADDLEIIAVISAAIAAAEGTSTDGFVVRSIRRRPSNKWNA